MQLQKATRLACVAAMLYEIVRRDRTNTAIHFPAVAPKKHTFISSVPRYNVGC